MTSSRRAEYGYLAEVSAEDLHTEIHAVHNIHSVQGMLQIWHVSNMQQMRLVLMTSLTRHVNTNFICHVYIRSMFSASYIHYGTFLTHN